MQHEPFVNEFCKVFLAHLVKFHGLQDVFNFYRLKENVVTIFISLFLIFEAL